MTVFVALLRAVNVGGTGKLAMPELAAMCRAAGFARVRTYIASGNVVLASNLDEAAVKAAIEAPVAAYVGKPVGVLVRTVAIFLDHAPAANALDHLRHRTSETVALGAREIYVAYGDTMGSSKLVIPAAEAGTARNMNTVAKLAKMAAGT
jgi:uncharacterized protein (DUF1697 family)